MKIGILTFHWATNYGAVLQTYALQTYLISQGHDVCIINYKPKIFDFNCVNFLRARQYRDILGYYEKVKKEKCLARYRLKHLKLTERVFTTCEVSKIANRYDIIISGSDQVLNPYFLKGGEGKGELSPAYFQGFPFSGRRIAYAVSFGCNVYPVSLNGIARQYIKNFEEISVREASGIDIVQNMGGKTPLVVPDPTALLLPSYYIDLLHESNFKGTEEYVYSYFIRNIHARQKEIPNFIKDEKIMWNNDDQDYTLESWLKKIYLAQFVITDSFHCVMMCLLLSKPFVAITELPGKDGMNDRLFTLLEPIGLCDRILYKENLCRLPQLRHSGLNNDIVNRVLHQMRETGHSFLNKLK